MKKYLKILVIIVGALAASIAAFVIWGYMPVPTFEPLVYEPIRPFADGYGYQWWLHGDGYYSAIGTSGQFITVAPEQSLIFVVTSKSRGLAQLFPAKLFFDYVLPAIESDDRLAPNEAALAELAALAGPPEYSAQPTPVPTLPAIATDVSGVTYRMENNPFNTNNIRFVFDPEKDYAELSYTARESWKIDCKIGLDGVHRFAESNPSRVAAVGEWVSPNTFFVEIEILGYSTFDTWEFTFEADGITVIEFSITGDYTYAGTGDVP